MPLDLPFFRKGVLYYLRYCQICPDIKHRHHTPQAVLLGLEGSDPETIDCGMIPSRYDAILNNKSLHLGGKRPIHFDMDRDMLWRWDQVLKTHPNGMRFSCFDENGDLLATNEYFRCGLSRISLYLTSQPQCSVGGGFVVNDKTKGLFPFVVPTVHIPIHVQSMKIYSTRALTNASFMAHVYTRPTKLSRVTPLWEHPAKTIQVTHPTHSILGTACWH